MILRHCAGMVDIETLSTEPSAVILSIGAVLFDPFVQNTADELANGHTFYVNVSPESQPESHSSEETRAWWALQSESARQAVLTNQQHVVDALRELHNFLVFRCGQNHPPAHEIWANSPSFDCVILSHAFRKYSKFPFPVPFFQHRDVRTAKELAWPHGQGQPLIHVGVAHNALDDCIKQALYVQAAYKVLGTTPL
jgi:hypothetical protein